MSKCQAKSRRRPDSIRHWLEGFYPVHRAGRSAIGIGVIAVELTEQKRAEANHRAVVAAMPDFIFELARDGTHLNFHAPHESALFVSPDQILGRTHQRAAARAVAAQYHQAIEQTLRSGAMQVFEYQLAYPDGERMFDARMVPKGPDEVLVVVRDITERERAERRRVRARRAAAPGAEDGSHRTTRRRHRARLQQPADDHQRLLGHAAQRRAGVGSDARAA